MNSSPKRKGEYSREEVDAAFARAFELRDANQMDEASREFERVLTQYPEASAAWAAHGEVRWSVNDLEGAIKCFCRAVALVPKHPIASQALFHALLESGRRREAEHEAGRFLALVRAKQVKDVPAELVEMYEMYVDDTSS